MKPEILVLAALFGGTLALQVTLASVEYVVRRVKLWRKGGRR